MIVINEHLKLDEKNTLTHLNYNFKLDKEYEKLVIKISYDPNKGSSEESRPLVKECIDRYVPEEYKDEYLKALIDLEIDNLITTSLSYNGDFWGAHHNKSNVQEISIAEYVSTLGYEKHRILPGEYIVTLSLHCISSKTELDLLVEAIDEQ